MSFEWLKQTKKYDLRNAEKLPVSVVLVVIKSRLAFVNAFVLPSIKMNNPAEIIIVDDENLTNQEKRNKGALQATQKYLFICDDDVVLPANHLSILCKVLEKNEHFAFAYTDYQAIVMEPLSHPVGRNYYHKSRKFDLEYLKVTNYIDTCSLVRRKLFPYFDPQIKRFQDWDLWLTIALQGHRGVYVKETGIIKYYLDKGITSTQTDEDEKRNIIKKKHNLCYKKVRIASEYIENKAYYRIVFFGASSLLTKVLQDLIEADLVPDYICDNSVDKHGMKFERYMVYSPEVIFCKNYKFLVIVTSSYFGEIKQQLKKYNNIIAIHGYSEVIPSPKIIPE